jgi:hypothetical protein
MKSSGVEAQDRKFHGYGGAAPLVSLLSLMPWSKYLFRSLLFPRSSLSLSPKNNDELVGP